jgi:hypothetical protein
VKQCLQLREHRIEYLRLQHLRKDAVCSLVYHRLQLPKGKVTVAGNQVLLVFVHHPLSTRVYYAVQIHVQMLARHTVR